MTALHTLGILSTSFTWNVFPTVLKEFPHMLSTCWLLFLQSAVQLISNHLNWVEVGWLWRPGHLMPYSITLLLGQIALTQPGGVLGYCPVEKQMIGPLSANQMGWRIAAECCGSHAGHQQSTPTPSHLLCHASRWEPHMQRSSVHLITKTRWLEPKISNLDSSDQRTDFHQSNVHCSCFLAQASLFFLLMSFTHGFIVAIWPWRPDSRNLWTVDVEMCLLLELWSIYLGCNLRCS